MPELLAFLARHGYALVFGFVLAEQAGLPLPALPVLLAVGALAAQGRVSLAGATLAAVVGSLVADLAWYELGRRRGRSILALLCKVSLEPDSCVRRTEDVFARHGARALLYAKFVPGLSTAAPPLAGLFQMRRQRFALWDGAGSLVWAGGLIALGRLFHDQIEEVLAWAARFGHGAATIAFGLASLYFAWKLLERRRFLREIRIARIHPEELLARLQAGEPVTVVDLRHSLDFEAEPATLPGALRLLPEEIERRHRELPRDREIVLLCT